MDATGYAQRAQRRATETGSALHRAATDVYRVTTGEKVIPGGISLRTVAIFTAIIVGAVLVAAARFYGVPVAGVLAQDIATENALTAHSSLAGIGGFVGTFIASSRLASVEGDTVSVRSLAGPVAVTFAGNALAGFLFPAAGGAPDVL